MARAPAEPSPPAGRRERARWTSHIDLRPPAEAGTAPHAVGPSPPFDQPVPCGGGRRVGGREAAARDAVQIGPLVFLGLGRERPRQRFARVTGAGPGPSFVVPLTVPVVVAPATRAVVAVAPEGRVVAGLDSGPGAERDAFPADAHRAVACATGPAQRTFEISFVVDGARCVPVSVTSAGRTTTRRIRFGVRRCSR